MDAFRKNSKKALVGLVGGLVVVIGVILIPYPGPGWLVVFSGLAILATEFSFARKLLHIGKAKYDAWVEWMKKQSWPIRLATLLFTCLVVTVTVWFVNGFGIAMSLVGLDIPWLVSPLFQ